MKCVPCTISQWAVNGNGALIATARPIDPGLFSYLGHISISRQSLHATGEENREWKVGDCVNVEILARAFRVFEKHN